MENDGPLRARGDFDVPVSGVSVHELNPTAAQSSGTMRRRINPSSRGGPNDDLSCFVFL
jgi:hypothetical protein